LSISWCAAAWISEKWLVAVRLQDAPRAELDAIVTLRAAFQHVPLAEYVLVNFSGFRI
jgi:hypothetical protein